MPWRSVLVIACAVAAVGQVGHALRQGHEANLEASLGEQCGDEDVAEVMQRIKEDPGCVNRVDFDGNTALSGAIHKRRLEVVKLLLKSGADVDGKYGGDKPLFLAAYYGNDEIMADIIRELVRYGAKVDRPDKKGNTPLFTAVRENSYYAVKALLKFKANVNVVDARDMQDTPLHVAVERGNAEIVKLLVNAKAKLNAKDSKGLTPLSIAVMKGHGEYYSDTSLMMPLLDAGAEVNAVNNRHQTALLLAVWDPHAVQLLLKHNADVNVADENGTTPLMAALEEKEVEPLVVEYLLEAKADVNVKLNHSTPLHLAVKKNLMDETVLLLAAEADVNVKDAEGKTPFDYAEGEVKELLKKHGGAGGESWRLWGAELKAKLKKKLKKFGFM
mmetsp:Transcript_26063/g.42509  ORF Transcript_26063/g.42509 Transcript_26063/m.42509 type:complete len:387 (+) Transcript_26063:49-1209(+)